MKVIVSRAARADIVRIRDGFENRDARERFRTRIEALFQTLASWPRAGRVVPELGDSALRELIVDNFRVWYRVQRDDLRVLAVWDARRGDLPDRTSEPLASYAN